MKKNWRQSLLVLGAEGKGLRDGVGQALRQAPEDPHVRERRQPERVPWPAGRLFEVLRQRAAKA